MHIFCNNNKGSYKNPDSKCAMSLNPLILRWQKVETKVFPLMERNVWANVCGRDVFHYIGTLGLIIEYSSVQHDANCFPFQNNLHSNPLLSTQIFNK